ncbi:unnamed protein product [Cuscuta epithymum]|uniref:Reverse transcriptase Ty1/copia-type domain-containing protein n=1 Tax=Cuscuta epithymum TaxID=186058 RepID=A0AAV0END2_9ASTE|nr:unnamed protein product [Cuscuta epithymum]
MLGYEEGTKGYRLLDPVKERIIVSRDVFFEEDKRWPWHDNQEEGVTNKEDAFTVNMEGLEADHDSETSNEDLGNMSQPTTPMNDDQSLSRTSSDASTDHLRYRSLQDIYDSTREIEEEVGLCFLAIDEPRNYEEAVGNQNWEEAMAQEINSIEKNGTWELTDILKNQKAIRVKWVFKLKKDPEGRIVNYKARLVAKGYVHNYGIDYQEVFAPIARMETVRTLLALTAQRGGETHHMDVKTAFLNGDLEEDVYVKQPEGFIDKENPNKVLKLHKALYGLKQAPRSWNIKLDKCLKSLTFEKCPFEHAVYARQDKNHIMIVGVYVDDLILTCSSSEIIYNFKIEMQKRFEMNDLGLLSYYLGIEVQQRGESITLCQAGYARKLLEKLGMAECNTCYIPMEPRKKLSKQEGDLISSYFNTHLMRVGVGF